VFDFTLGNPDVEPPAAVIEALREVVRENKLRSHGYMPNAGYPAVRAEIARRLEGRTGLPFTEAEVMMTCGAAGAINATLRSVLDPGDEVIVLSPYFPEYRSYVDNFGGKTIEVQTSSDFQPDVSRISAAITSRTKVLILNAPNNPTGAVYSEEALREINKIVREPMIVISDEPYRPITFDGAQLPEALKCIDRCVLAWSWSKAMAVAGERIGYLAVSPRLPEKAQLMSAVIIVGHDAASQIYVETTIKVCYEVGIQPIVFRLRPQDGQTKLMRILRFVQSTPDIHGVILQNPLPPGDPTDPFNLLNAYLHLPEYKDIDCSNLANVARLAMSRNADILLPATQGGLILAIELFDIPMRKPNGRAVDVGMVGQGRLVGRPTAMVLMDRYGITPELFNVDSDRVALAAVPASAAG
jgi:hypothetical protein